MQRISKLTKKINQKLSETIDCIINSVYLAFNEETWEIIVSGRKGEKSVEARLTLDYEQYNIDSDLDLMAYTLAARLKQDLLKRINSKGKRDV